MTSSAIRSLSVLLGIVLLSASTAAAPKARSYVVVDLGTLPGGESSQASGINDRGQVVGTSLVAGAFRPFLWQNGVMTELPMLPGATSGGANGINDRGQIVGSNTIDGVAHAVAWHAGRVYDLGRLPGASGCVANAVNERAQVVGACDMVEGGPGGFIWDNGRMVSLGSLPGGDFIFPTGINRFGQVVGVASNAAFQFRAFGWWKGRIYDLGTLPGGSTSTARAINDRGQIAGWSDDETFTPFAVVWALPRLHPLGTLPGASSSQAWAINNHGQITGRSDQMPFVWENGTMAALPTLQGGTGIGVAINNRGAIAGQADNGFGQARATIWVDSRTRLQEPGLVWDFGPETGLATPGEGAGTVLFNASTLQNFVDAVTFRRDTVISGMNVFTSSSHLPLVGTHFRVKILRDEGGQPGAPVAEFDVVPTNITFTGLFTTTGGQTADVYRVRLDFPPVTFEGGATFWIGASGFNFDAGLYGVVGPGDGQMAFFDGDTLGGPAPESFGDMMFQLFSPASR